ncbi:zinc finger CCCH domain-containing protein 36-like [Phragmites australis]|uniref:zinc finger CCCH domain-containing protein 36-like n=1 Tax=Phragmites australis TaxID=29695 RepID=UPI002D78CF83|nr:zinc finger CCCH domain-containing protein 36-like [Phragmites australis]XP_062180024.1 zinc finger CCCH domain-containing protein 36-like [Phragmites australis]XP_062180025.1 zinc finger CCCH domain-containing protein 36-like [Phragmites australis]XP_062180026.1 zinc finger CCCH domain-containing protein 36-like [Phragmites australis]
MASASGGVRATDEIPDVEMEVVEWPPEDPGRIGSKRVRDSPIAKGSYGFCGVATAEKKPTNGSQTLPDSNLRFSSSSPSEDLENEIKRPTKPCIFYVQGRCKKGNSCTFLHEREGPGSDNRWSNEDKDGLLTPVAYGNSIGSKQGSQLLHLSNSKAPLFKNPEGSSKDELYRTLIHAYGEDNKRLTHLVDKQTSPTLGISQGMICRIDDSLSKKPTTLTNGLVQIPVVHEKNHEPYFMGRHISLTPDTYLVDRSTFPRLHLDGEMLQFDVDKGNGSSDSHVSRAYLETNPASSNNRYRSLAYGGTTENLPQAHQKEHRSSHASYSSHSLTGFRNPGFSSSDHSFGSPTLQTSHLKMLSSHQLTPGIKKAGLHRYDDVDKGCGTYRPVLLASDSPQASIVSAGSLSPIKDEVWETSVPFVPSFSFPDSTTSSRSQYDPFVDSVDPPKVESTNNLRSANISCSISSQHTNQNASTDKLLNCDDKLTRNMSVKGSNELAFLIASGRVRSSSLHGNDRVKACDRKNDAASNNEKTREFRFRLAEHVKELVKPIWKEGYLSKDAHKMVVKKSVDKVLGSLEPDQVPATEELITNYLTVSGSKIEKLVKAYVDRHHTA